MQKSSFLHELVAISCFMLMSLAVISNTSNAHPSNVLNSSAAVLLADTDVIINEIHYNPCGNQGNDSNFEFVELFNSGSTTVDLSGWYFSNGITFTFPNGSSIAAGEYIVIAINADSFSGNGYQVFEFGGGLSNNGERIRLRDDNGNTIDDVTYDDNNGWPNEADGGCNSLELVDASSNNNNSSSWEASTGEPTPGGPNSVSGTPGCTDPSADNYNSNATIEDGSCTYTIMGCTDPAANNYNSSANTDDGSCAYTAPSASFTYSILSTNCGLITIEFTNTSTDANSYSWDFGGLQSSSETSPTLSFTAGAPINVSLSATNPSGTDTVSQSVSLTDNSSSFTVIMELQPDCFAGELSWSFLDPNDVEIDGQNTGDIATTALITREFCVTADCYTIVLDDSFSDGFAGNGISGCTFDGALSFKDALGNVIYVYEGAADWGANLTQELCFVSGCTDSAADNYNANALINDNTCIYPNTSANFTYEIISNACGVAQVSFTNTSVGASNSLWDFGLGALASSENSPTISLPSGISTDVNLAVSNINQSADTTISVIIPESAIEGSLITFSIQPDCWGEELSWVLTNSANDTIQSINAGDYVFTTTPSAFEYDFCLADGCYTVELNDTYGDGFAGGTLYTGCDFDGTYSFKNSEGTILSEYGGNANYGFTSSDLHCMNEIYIWKGTISSVWNTAGNWEENSVPLAGKSIKIDTDIFDPVYEDNNNFKHLTINPGAALSMLNSSSILNLSGNLTNNGVFNTQTGTVQFNGNGIQLIKGDNAVSFNRLKVNGATEVILLQDMNLWGALQMESGFIDFQDKNVSLLSDANTTGSIGTLTDLSSIQGDQITFNKYWASGSANWRMMSSPINDATFEQWNDDFPTTGFVGSDFPTYPFSNIRTYNESFTQGLEADRNFGFESIANISDTINSALGYFVYFDPASSTIDLTGTFNRGPQNIPLTYNLSEMAGENDGWNLVANPFPSAIDWDSDGITKVGLASAVYVYDPSSGQYSSYVSGISVGPLDGLISSGQAFWVKAIEDNPSLIIDEAAKSDDQGVHLRSTDFNTSATIRLALESTNRSDEVVFGFNDDCSADFDKDYDAFKFYPSSTNTPSLAIYPNGFDTAPYVVSMSQFPSEMFQLPLEVKRGNQTQFTLSLVEVDADNELCMLIEDLETGSKHSLSIGESYAFEMTATSPEERFIIHLAPPLDVAVINEHCFGAEDGEIIAQGFGDAPWNFIWKDEMGQVIQENNQMTNSDHLSNLAPGLYEVIVQGSNELCSSTSSMVMVETAELPELSSSFAQTSCNYSTGEIQVEVNDDYNWNFELFDENNALVGSFSQEENGAVFSNLSAGLYELHAENECNETVSFDVFNLNDPFASSISINNTEFEYHTNENIVFTATNENCQEITWSLGNGDVISSNENLIYEYNESGTFEVIVTGSNAYCSSSDTLTMIISDREVADITVPFVDVELDELTDENEKGENEIALNITDAEINFNFGDKTYEKLNLSIYSITGQLVHRAVITNTQTFNVSTADFPSGIYHIEMNDDVQVLLSEKCYLD